MSATIRNVQRWFGTHDTNFLKQDGLASQAKSGGQNSWCFT